MKKFLALLTVLILSLVLVLPAAAGRGPGGGEGCPGTGDCDGSGARTAIKTEAGLLQRGMRGTVALVGTITAVGTDSVSIQVEKGNTLAADLIGTIVTVTITPETRLMLRDGTTCAPITLADLAIGQQVSLNGIQTETGLVVYRITVGAFLFGTP